MTGRLLAETEVRRAARTLGRRDVLRLAGFAAAAGIVPSGCRGVPSDLAPPAGVRLRILTPRTYAVFTAAAARLVGPAGASLIRARGPDVGRQADRFLAGTPETAGPLGQALLVLEFGVWPLVPKLRPFTALDEVAQDAVLGGLMRSRFDLARRLFGGVRSLAYFAFYGARESRPLTGYPGPFGSDTVTIGDAMVERDADFVP
jgi:hypothetical protein